MRRWFSYDDPIGSDHPQGISYLALQDGTESAGSRRSVRVATSAVALRHVYLVLLVLTIGVFFLAVNVYQLHSAKRPDARMGLASQMQQVQVVGVARPVVWIRGRNGLHTMRYMRHVFQAFERLGYRTVQSVNGGGDDWDVLWAHDYPFTELANVTRHITPHQTVNHFPGAGFIANKVSLATTMNSSYIPRAFRLPRDKESFLEHARNFPYKVFVQKGNKHRGIRVKNLESLELDQQGSFVQEFIENPYLIDGRKFDIGVYTIVTSIDPLRVYVYNGDVILRFCSANYNPFDQRNTNKYVVGDDYTPIWKIPSLKGYYETLGFTMKESLNAHLRSRGVEEPSFVWLQMEDAIVDVLLAKEPAIIASLSNYKFKRGFFELFRFDFLLDGNLNVHIMEVNMSPNLSSAHFMQNRLIYEQVIYNTLSLVGLVNWSHGSEPSSVRWQSSMEADRVRVSERDVSVYADACSSLQCVSNVIAGRPSCAVTDAATGSVDNCRLCRPCLPANWMRILHAAFREHTFRHNCRRIFPVPSKLRRNANGKLINEIRHPLSKNNMMMIMWFEGKCFQDPTFC